MSSIHAKLQAIQSELKAPKGQTNTFGKYKYRSCEDILEAVKPLLKEQGLTLTLSDEMVDVGGRIYVKATAKITGEDGSSECVNAFARESADKKGMDEAQITGAASSYARKYALNGLFCIDDTKDADTMDNRKEHPPLAINEKFGTVEDAVVKAPKTQPTVTVIVDKINDCPTVDSVATVWTAAMKYTWSPEDMKTLAECRKNVENRLNNSVPL